MKHAHRNPRFLSLGLAALTVAGLLACGPQGDTAPADQGQADNVVLLKVPTDPTVSFNLWFHVGSINDPAGKEGLAALTGAMIARGATEKNPYPTILEKLYPLAAGYDIRVDKEMTTLTGRTHVDNLDVFVELLGDAVLSPAFDTADFERLKSNQLNALKTQLRYADDEELGKAALRGFVFAGTSNAHPVEGTVSGVESLTLDDVKTFYQQHFTQANVTLGLGGGFDDALVERMQKTLAGLPAGEATPAVTIDTPAIQGRQVQLVEKPDADASISFGFPIDVRRGDRDLYALWVANSWLGEHRNTSSHLFQVIRELRGMNYGDYSYIEAFPEGGRRQMPPTNVARKHQLFEVWIRTLPNEQAIFALRAALREVQNLVENGMSKEDFELTRSFMSKYHLHFAPTTGARLGYRIDDAFYGVDGDGHLARFAEVLPTLTHEEVNAAIRKHWQVDNLKIAIVTGDADGLRQTLESDSPTPMSYESPKPPEILEEDKIIASFPLAIAEGGVATIPVDEIFQ